MKKIILSFLSMTLVFAGGVNGGNKLLTISTARTLHKGQFTMSSSLNFFTEAFNRILDAKGKFGFNFWQVNGDLSFSYGVSSQFELSLNTRLYQDTHHKKNNFPSVVSIDAKFGLLGVERKSFTVSGGVGLQMGVGHYHNLPYDDYVSKGFTVKPKFIFSYFTDRYLPEDFMSIHFGAGLDFSFDNGTEISSSRGILDTLVANTSRVNYNFGIKIPTDAVDILFEVDGYGFLTEPGSTMIYGRESRMVLNIGFKYNLSPFLSFDFGLGFNVQEGEETTTTGGKLNILISAKESGQTNFSGYSPWRGFLGVNLTFQPKGAYGVSRLELERNEYYRKIQTFKTLIEEEENSELIEQELYYLKKEREKAEKELEELKKVLEN